MTIQTGNKITAADVNNLADSIEAVYATGTGDSGYGQTQFIPDTVPAGKKISATEWSKIRGMLMACTNHQGLANASVFSDPTVGAKIMASTSAIAIVTACVAGRLNASPDATTPFDDVADAAYAASWNGVMQVTVDVSFQTEDQARYFFNSGGQIEINLTHPNGTTPQDISFRSFLARQLGTLYVSAHSLRLSGIATASTVPNLGYYELPASETMVIKQISTDYLSTQADTVEIHLQRTGYTGLRGANGTGFQAIILASFMGDINGSMLSPGLSVDIDTIKATKYLTVAAPNCAVSGFHQLSVGNTKPGAPDSGNPGGGVSVIDPYDPAPGTVTYTVPDYATIMFELKGGGGSEGSSTGPYPRSDGATIYLAAGTDGEDATIDALGLVAKGGKGGGTYNLTTKAAGAVGADGVGTGGDVNTTGGGAAGGSAKYAGMTNYLNGSAGGAGAYVKKTYVRGQAGAPNPGDVLVLTVPIGGSQSGVTVPKNVPTEFFPGADGSRGQVKVTVTKPTTGSASFQTPGTYTFSVPSYSSITFDVSGAGGGQGHPYQYQKLGDFYPGSNPSGRPVSSQYGFVLPDGNPGGNSQITELGMTANGGAGGTYAPTEAPIIVNGVIVGTSGLAGYLATAKAGANGGASGGQTNTAGGGASGGYILYFGPRVDWQLPWEEGANGGNGGRCTTTYAPTDLGAPAANSTVTIIVGAGGAPAQIGPGEYCYGYVYATGLDGSVNIKWSGTATSVDTPA